MNSPNSLILIISRSTCYQISLNQYLIYIAKSRSENTLYPKGYFIQFESQYGNKTNMYYSKLG